MTMQRNIAEENMSDDYESVNDYITEVKKINKLSSDQIQDSQYLMVPYYSYNKQFGILQNRTNLIYMLKRLIYNILTHGNE